MMKQMMAMCGVLPLFFLFLSCGSSRHSALDDRIDALLQGKDMKVGISVKCGGFEYVRNNDTMFPLMSVFKVHVAAAVLADMERRGVGVDTVIHVDKAQLHENTYSPLRDEHPGEDIDISVAELVRRSVAESDNNACDVLIGLVGGIDRVEAYARSICGTDVRLRWTEDDMHADVSRCRENCALPSSVTTLLCRLYEGNDGKPVFPLLADVMLGTTTGPDKMRAGVPEGWPVAHKTGSSDRVDGVKIGDNDAGVVYMPGGERCYIAVLVTDSRETDAVNAAVIAGVTRAVLQHIVTLDK